MANLRVALAMSLALVLSAVTADNAEAQVWISKYGRDGGINIGFGRGGVNVGGYVNTGRGSIGFNNWGGYNNWGGFNNLGYGGWSGYPRNYRYRGYRGSQWNGTTFPRYYEPSVSRDLLYPTPYYDRGWGSGNGGAPLYYEPSFMREHGYGSQNSGWQQTPSGDFLPGRR